MQVANPNLKVDIVYLWVDDSDPKWLEKKSNILGNSSPIRFQLEGRYKNSDELKYSLRSVEKYAPWVNKIFIVTDEQYPDWLDVQSPWLQLVDHKDIFPNLSDLPTFNSAAIDTCLHNVPNLSEHFLYFNDDMFIGAPVKPEHFFLNGHAKLFCTSKKSAFRRKKLLGINDSLSTWQKNINLTRQVVLERQKRLICNEPTHTAKVHNLSEYRKLADRYEREFNQNRAEPFRHDRNLVIPALYSMSRQADGEKPITLTRLKAKSVMKYWRSKRDPYSCYSMINLNMSEAKLKRELGLITRVNPFLYCLNDCEGTPEKNRQIMIEFLQQAFPDKSKFER